MDAGITYGTLYERAQYQEREVSDWVNHNINRLSTLHILLPAITIWGLHSRWPIVSGGEVRRFSLYSGLVGGTACALLADCTLYARNSHFALRRNLQNLGPMAAHQVDMSLGEKTLLEVATKACGMQSDVKFRSFMRTYDSGKADAPVSPQDLSELKAKFPWFDLTPPKSS